MMKPWSVILVLRLLRTAPLALSQKVSDDTCLLQTSTRLDMRRMKDGSIGVAGNKQVSDAPKPSASSASKSNEQKQDKEFFKGFKRQKEFVVNKVDAQDENFAKESTTPCMENQFGQPAWPCGIERHSRDIVRKWLPSDSTVLEIGARYGSVSCVIAAMQHQSGKVVSVEPDPAVSHALDKNLQKHGCKVKVLKAVVGSTPVTMQEDIVLGGFATHTAEVTKGTDKGATKERLIPAYPLAQVEKEHKMHFDTFVADCEGCFSRFLRESPEVAKQAKMIIVEVHNDDEAKSVDDLQKKDGFKVVDKISRQYVLKHS